MVRSIATAGVEQGGRGRMSGPSNAVFFAFLSGSLAASLFKQEGDSLISFKGTIEFALVPEGTDQGPDDGFLCEGTAALSYGAWCEIAGRFVMTSVESHGGAPGQATRVYHACDTNVAGAPQLPVLAPDEDGDVDADPRNAVVEELRTGRWRLVWTGPGRGTHVVGRLVVYARRIACRGADSGMPARLIFSERLRLYRANGR